MSSPTEPLIVRPLPESNKVKHRVSETTVGGETAASVGTSWLSLLALGFLTFNCFQAVYRARHDPWTVSFVVSAYVALVLLFGCLRQLEKLPRDGSRGREERWLKFLVWALAMFLNLMFSFRVAAMMPPVLAAAVWTTAGVATVVGFYAFFIYREPAVVGGAPAVPSAKV